MHKEDRRPTGGFGEREEWTLHQVTLIARAGVTGRDDEGLELAALAIVDELVGHGTVRPQRWTWSAAWAST